MEPERYLNPHINNHPSNRCDRLMKRNANSILNAELSHAIASLGHTDILMVVDAGYPIPENTWRIDLALTRGTPGQFEVLKAIHNELIPENIMYAEAVSEKNPGMEERLQELYQGTGAGLSTIPHENVLEYGSRSKVIVRTGAFAPWGNVIIKCGTDPKVYFDSDDVTMPEEYQHRYEEMYGDPP